MGLWLGDKELKVGLFHKAEEKLYFVTGTVSFNMKAN